jgi:hypothetical protein
MLYDAWKTSRYEISSDLEAPFLRMIRLPFMKNYQANNAAEACTAIDQLNLDLFERHKIISVVVYVDQALWIRISCFVANQLSDFEKLRDAILDLQ